MELEWNRGIPAHKLEGAPPLEVVKSAVGDILADKYVTGHGVETTLINLDVNIDDKFNKDIALYPVCRTFDERR